MDMTRKINKKASGQSIHELVKQEERLDQDSDILLRIMEHRLGVHNNSRPTYRRPTMQLTDEEMQIVKRMIDGDDDDFDSE